MYTLSGRYAMLRFNVPIYDLPPYNCKDSKECESIDSQILTLFNGNEKALKRKQSEYSPDFETCFDSDFLFDLARIEDTEKNSNILNNTDSCLYENISHYAHDPPRKKQKRRDSLITFQSMIDDGDLDFDDNDEHKDSTNFELSLPKVAATTKSSKFCKDPAEDIRKNLSNRVEQLMSSSVGNDLQNNWGNVKKARTRKNIFAPPSIIGECNISTMKPLISFQDGLLKSLKSHQLLTQWDDMMGLRQCHARTMIKSARSRKKLLKVITNSTKKVS